MPDIRTSVHIEATPAQVWEEVRHIDRHVGWMADAAEIRFHGDQREGVGTTFTTVTKVGPLRTSDVMEVTEWEPAATMGVRHSGAVTGTGRFTLEPAGNGTHFVWTEDLTLPWYFGGRLGAVVAKPLLAWIWRRNLRGLKEQVEATLNR